MQNLRHPRWGSADLGENRRIWGVRRTRVRRAPKSAIEKARIQYGEFRRNSTDYRLISKISESGTFFFSPRAFSISSNVTALFLLLNFKRQRSGGKPFGGGVNLAGAGFGSELERNANASHPHLAIG